MYAALACHTHKHNRRESTSVIGSLIFASARRQAPRNCEYRYSMTALRANKTDNPPSERQCLSLTDRFSPSSLSQSASFVAYFCSLFVPIRAPMFDTSLQRYKNITRLRRIYARKNNSKGIPGGR